MMTVYKYPISITDDISVNMPAGAQVLCVQMQREKPCIWALIDTEETEIVAREFRLAGTGHQVDFFIGPYVGTFQMLGGELVYHLFEKQQEGHA